MSDEEDSSKRSSKLKKSKKNQQQSDNDSEDDRKSSQVKQNQKQIKNKSRSNEISSDEDPSEKSEKSGSKIKKGSKKNSESNEERTSKKKKLQSSREDSNEESESSKKAKDSGSNNERTSKGQKRQTSRQQEEDSSEDSESNRSKNKDTSKNGNNSKKKQVDSNEESDKPSEKKNKNQKEQDSNEELDSKESNSKTTKNKKGKISKNSGSDEEQQSKKGRDNKSNREDSDNNSSADERGKASKKNSRSDKEDEEEEGKKSSEEDDDDENSKEEKEDEDDRQARYSESDSLKTSSSSQSSITSESSNSSSEQSEQEQSEEGESEDRDKQKKKGKVGKERGKKEISRMAVDKALEQMRKDINKYLKTKVIPLRTFFRKIDTRNISYLDFFRFRQAIQDYMPTVDDEDDLLMDALFKRFDVLGRKKVGFQEFKSILEDEVEPVDTYLLIQTWKEKLQLTPENALDYFKSMDTNDDKKIDFQEFSRYIGEFLPDLSGNEIEAVYKKFDKEGNGYFQYEDFLALLLEGHYKVKQVKQALEEYLEKNNMSFEEFFSKFSGGRHSWRIENFQSALQELPQCQSFTEDVLGEIFDLIDTDKSGLLSVGEVREALFDDIIKRVDVQGIIKKIRFCLMQQRGKVNVYEELKILQAQESVSHEEWQAFLQKMEIKISQIEDQAVFQHFSVGGGVDNSKARLNVEMFINLLSEIQLDLKPMKKALQELGNRYQKSNGELFDIFDSNQDQIMELQEFEQMIKVLKLSMNEQDIVEAFELFDFDGNGRIGKQEFINVVEGVKENNKFNFSVVLNQLKEIENNIQTIQQVQSQQEFMARQGVFPLIIAKPHSASQHHHHHHGQKDNFDDLVQKQNEKIIQSSIEQQQVYAPQEIFINPYLQTQILPPQIVQALQTGQLIPYNPDQIVEMLRVNCLKKQLDLFDVFSCYDSNLSCTLRTQNQLEEVFSRLGFQPNQEIVQRFYKENLRKFKEVLYEEVEGEKQIGEGNSKGLEWEQWGIEQQSSGNIGRSHPFSLEKKQTTEINKQVEVPTQMDYLQILIFLLKPAHLMKKMILHAMKCMKMNYQIFFKKILDLTKNYSKVWHYPDLKYLNTYFRLNYDPVNTLKVIWEEWDRPLNRRLTMEELALALKIPLNYEPEELVSNEFVKASRRRNAADSKFIKKVIFQVEKVCRDLKVNVMDLFNYFDQDNDFLFETPQNLQKIMDLLHIELTKEEVEMLYYYFTAENTHKMRYMLFVRQIATPEQLLRTYIKKVMLGHMWSFVVLFQKMQYKPNKLQILTFQDFYYFNVKHKIDLTEMELNQVFQDWCSKGDSYTINIGREGFSKRKGKEEEVGEAVMTEDQLAQQLGIHKSDDYPDLQKIHDKELDNVIFILERRPKMQQNFMQQQQDLYYQQQQLLKQQQGIYQQLYKQQMDQRQAIMNPEDRELVQGSKSEFNKLNQSELSETNIYIDMKANLMQRHQQIIYEQQQHSFSGFTRTKEFKLEKEDKNKLVDLILKFEEAVIDKGIEPLRNKANARNGTLDYSDLFDCLSLYYKFANDKENIFLCSQLTRMGDLPLRQLLQVLNYKENRKRVPKK